MKNTIATIIGLLMILSLNAQSSLVQTIKGTVVDIETDYPLIGVNVLILENEGSHIGSTTDIDGNFVLNNIPVGRQKLQFSYIGYSTVTIPNILVASAKESILYIQMEEDVIEMESVVITASQDKRKPINEMAAISARSMTMEEVTRFSGSTGDVARMAQNYAGVSGASDDRNDIIVRGNSPATVLYRMEGVDIPAPNHWAALGTSGGPISLLNTNNLRNSDFLTGAFPAEYGNVVGAVFDLKLRNGNTDKYEFLGQMGFNGFEVGVEGPIKIGKNASFIANYRYSTLGVFQAMGINFGTGSSIPEYQDITFKINIPTDKMGRFSLWGIGGVSGIELEASKEDGNLYAQGEENVISGSNTGVVGFSHVYFFNENTSSKTSIVWSGSLGNTSVEEIRNPSDTFFTKFYSSVNYTGKVGVNWTLNKKFNAKNRVKIGIIYDRYDIAVKDSILNNDNHWFTELDYTGQPSMYRTFVQWQHKFNNKLTMNAGVHTTYFALNDHSSIEPRFNLSYDLNDKMTFAIGYGRHAQLQPLPIYFSKERGASAEKNAKNLDLDMMKSHHFVASMDYLMNKNLRVKIEAYYQSLSDLAVNPERGHYSSINDGFSNYAGLENGGAGKNIGMEFTVERFLNKGFYTLFTASIFDSKFQGYDKVERNTQFNSNYVFNLLAGKEFVLSKKNAITVDMKFNYAGGRRYTPIDLEASIAAGEQIRDKNRILEAQRSPYIRPDVKIGYRRNGKKTTHRFYIDFQNVINKQNEFYQYYNVEKETIVTNHQRGFFPDISYQILF